jgi:hypothetical protein
MPLLLCTTALCQTVGTGSAETKGQCSPANTGNNNVFNITCGIGKEKGEQMLKILNRILSSQLDPNEVMGRLDEILRGVNEIKLASADRRLSTPQRELLLALLRPFKGEKLAISSSMNDPEAYRFAQDFADVLRETGFELAKYAIGSETTGVNPVEHGVPTTGVEFQVSNEQAWRTPLAQRLNQALNFAQIDHTLVYSRQPRDSVDFGIYIGAKPLRK